MLTTNGFILIPLIDIKMELVYVTVFRRAFV